jgi:TatD DNase family protein
MATLVDTHCHLNFDAFDTDRAEVVARAAAAGVTRIIIPAVDLATSREALALADEYEGVYAAIGIHPNSTADFAPAMLDDLRALLPHPKVVAIGEIGLDYYWKDSPPDKQKEAFLAQLAFANEVELPIIIHNREAHADILELLEAWQPHNPQRVGVLHSSSAPMEYAQRALAKGFYLGFTGPITYKKAEETRHIAAHIPLDRILVETDAPFLTPEPYRGKRNTPEYIPYIVERLASVRGITPEAMAQASTDNAICLFALK